MCEIFIAAPGAASDVNAFNNFVNQTCSAASDGCWFFEWPAGRPELNARVGENSINGRIIKFVFQELDTDTEARADI